MPTGQRDIFALERHQRLLSYGGGALLSGLIVLVLVAWVVISAADYRADQLNDFRKAKLALDAAFIQRDAGYVRTLNLIEYAWREKSADLDATGKTVLPEFQAAHEQALIHASPSAMPWLVLGDEVDRWPAARLQRYLGLMNQISVISGTSLTVRGHGAPTFSYFYDSSASLFALGYTSTPMVLGAMARPNERPALFKSLRIGSVDLSNPRTLGALETGNPILPFYGPDLPRVLSSTGINPVTGQRALIGSMVAMDGDKPIGVFVAYEPIARFTEQVTKVSSQPLALVDGQGKLVFSTGSSAQDENLAQLLRQLPSSWRGVSASTHRLGSHYVIVQHVAGTEWLLVRQYGWSEILHGKRTPIAVAVGLTALLLMGLWLLIIRQYREVFAPVLARAKQVYQSELLNRTMIATSPVGLCVIGMPGGMPLLQNDLVRDYASVDDDAGLYRRLLQQYAASTQMVEHRPEAREFELTVREKNGDRRHLLVSAMPIVYRDRRALYCVLRDATARVELAENLRRARADSEQAKLAAESASRAKTAFVATMSHEIRTPLNGILGHLELLGRSRLEPGQRERLDRIRLSADALLGIISDVLDFSRIEAGQLEIDPIDFELRALVEQTALLYAPAVQRKGLKLYYSLEVSGSTHFVADMHRMRQVLNNLVSNAVKFTESGRIVLRVRELVHEGASSARLRFEVIDSGIGMSEAQRSQVFQPFSQANASISRRFGGSGLGLTLCRQISDLMGGQIEVQTTAGVGSVFSFEVPVQAGAPTLSLADSLAGMRVVLLSAAAEWRHEIGCVLSGWGVELMVASLPSEVDSAWLEQADALLIFGSARAWDEPDESALIAVAPRVIKATADGPLVPEQRGEVTHISCYVSSALLASLQGEAAEALPGVGVTGAPIEPDESPYSILLVDDNPVNRELIEQQLQTLGYTVSVAEDGAVALRLWQPDTFDLVLTDINMPVMNGYELAARLRQMGVTVPILAVSATALISERGRCKEVGIDDLLLKPISLERLGNALRNFLPLRRVPIPESSAPAWVSQYPEKICRVFVESGQRDLEAIRQAQASGDQAGLLARLHSLKGALLMLGEQVMAEQCSALEKQVEVAGLDASIRHLELFEQGLLALLRRYADSLPG